MREEWRKRGEREERRERKDTPVQHAARGCTCPVHCTVSACA